MPSPLALGRYLPRELSPSVDSRPCSSPSELPGKAGKLFLGNTPPRAPRLPRRLAWCCIDWEQVRLLHRLGTGGFGSVYKATYHGVPVAIKQVSKQTKNLRASQRSFWAELNIARLHHDNIVRVVAASTRTPTGSNSLGTIIMEFGGNITLHQVIYGATSYLEEEAREPHHCERKQLCLGKCLKYSLDVVNGLLFLHSQSIVHLDLKPANILISEQDVCKIGDFGCSEKLEDLRCFQTPPYHLGGTYTHQAPELLKGEPVTTKADIYSFAITLWQMTTREVPYSGEQQYVLYAVVAHNLRPSLAAAVFTDSVLGQRLESIIDCCWRALAVQRPSAELLLKDLSSLNKLIAVDSKPVSR
ncbi:proto-oncogene serine/threonine-protein kinase mos [Fukomys damarensis]|uniref:Proto-oncogene serine/threonine-protein kinase mos n=1 Tax=Fukomys damarensis TaxID=885580 RepID=A0A091CQR0_FUKDA|nr:proto-oncogene serine/threonine-protein kinase mos [Fukomys damarensis]KFO20492.1 Serine/threonine-protein kinase-transforming protein mos [Fukomys damarensis]